MCLICVELEMERMTVREALHALQEFCDEEDEHHMELLCKLENDITENTAQKESESSQSGKTPSV